jgi:hypothetical protein
VAFDKRPHVILILSDLTAPLTGATGKSSATWLAEFCTQLEKRWQAASRRKNKLISMVLILNKKDKVDDDIVAKRTKHLRKILEGQLKQALGAMVEPVAILPCSSVINPDGPLWIDAVIMHIAKELAK